MPSDPGNLAPDAPKLAYRRLEAARAIGVSPRKLDQIKADRTSGIPFVKIGTRVVFPVAELREWLAAQIKGGER